MKVFLLLLLPLLFGGNALAQYSGPAVEACRAYAKRELPKEGASTREVVIERDASLVIERYTKKVGSQFVSSVLSGNAAIVLADAPGIELAFVCLLADEKKPVMFHWLPRGNVSALAQCTRAPDLRKKPRPCLEYLQRVIEQDLSNLYANSFQDARERDSKRGDERFVAAHRKSNAEWLQYREAECTRRRDFAPEGVSPDDVQLACEIDLMRRRALDLR